MEVRRFITLRYWRGSANPLTPTKKPNHTAMTKKLKPMTVTEMASRGGHAKWRGKSKKERADMLANAREAAIIARRLRAGLK